MNNPGGMMPCATCREMISTQAEKCPRCGRPTFNSMPASKLLVIVVLVLIGSGVLFWGWGSTLLAK